jgi:hypothetical protein
MLFTPKVQWVLNYKTNNIGDQVERENQIMAFGNRFEGVRRNFSENSWLNVENALHQRIFLLTDICLIMCIIFQLIY